MNSPCMETIMSSVNLISVGGKMKMFAIIKPEINGNVKLVALHQVTYSDWCICNCPGRVLSDRSQSRSDITDRSLDILQINGSSAASGIWGRMLTTDRCIKYTETISSTHGQQLKNNEGTLHLNKVTWNICNQFVCFKHALLCFKSEIQAIWRRYVLESVLSFVFVI